MKFKKVGVLTSEKSWFLPYAKKLVGKLKNEDYNTHLFLNHKDINTNYEVIFILGYSRIIKKEFLKKHKHNLVVHESDLPKGRGSAPLFWQILEGKNSIPIVLFEAIEKCDAGDVYLKDYITLEGDELNKEIRKKQAIKTIELCLRFLKEKIKPTKQKGKSTFYRKRTSDDSELDINKSIKSQFNQLRIVNNQDFPAFFYHNGHKYIIRIFRG